MYINYYKCQCWIDFIFDLFIRMERVLTYQEIQKYEEYWLQAQKEIEEKQRMLTDNFMWEFVDINSNVPSDLEDDEWNPEYDWEYYPWIPVGADW